MAQANSKAGKQKAVASKKKGNGPQARKSTGSNQPSAEQRYLMVQEAAYYHAQKAGFVGDSTEHWLAAEREVEQRLNGR